MQQRVDHRRSILVRLLADPRIWRCAARQAQRPRAASPPSRCAGRRRRRCGRRAGSASKVARIITATEAAISHAGAAPRMIRDGIVTGAIGGMNAVTWRERPVRVLVDGEAREQRDQDQHRQRRRRALDLLLARHERARGRVGGGVEGVAEHEPARARARPRRRRSPSTSSDAGRGRDDQPEDGDDQQLAEARAGRARSPCPPAGRSGGSWPAGPRSPARPSPPRRRSRPSSRRSAAGRRGSGSRRRPGRPWRRGRGPRARSLTHLQRRRGVGVDLLVGDLQEADERRRRAARRSGSCRRRAVTSGSASPIVTLASNSSASCDGALGHRAALRVAGGDRVRRSGRRSRAAPAARRTSTTIASVMPVEIMNERSRTRSVNSRRATSRTAFT